jgi:hypothetical protein
VSGEKERQVELLIDKDLTTTLDCVTAAIRALGVRIDKLEKRLRSLEETYGVEEGGPLAGPFAKIREKGSK